jgi:hypothetical protein
MGLLKYDIEGTIIMQIELHLCGQFHTRIRAAEEGELYFK